MTGVTYSVMNCDTTSPPTITMPERPARRAVGPEARGDRHRADHRGQRGHDDRPEAVHARVVDGLLGRLAGVHALAREVHDHDSVLLHDAHQHEHADERVERRLLAE